MPTPYDENESEVTQLEFQGLVTSTSTDIQTLTTDIASSREFLWTQNGFSSGTNFGDGGVTYSSGIDIDDAAQWRRFGAWDSVEEINGSASTFVTASSGNYHSVQVKKAGYYKATVSFQARDNTRAQCCVALRFAKNDVLLGPVTTSTMVDGSSTTTRNAISGFITHVILCAVDDTLQLYTSRVGAAGTVTCSAHGLTTLLVERL